jgi:tight adherence protein B
VLIATGLSVYVLVPCWDYLAARQMGTLKDSFDRLGADGNKLRLFLRIWGLTFTAVVVVLGWLLRMPPLAVVAAGLLYMAPRHVLDYVVLRRKQVLSDQMVTAAVAIGNAVKAGLSIAQAIENVSRQIPLPLGSELTRIAVQFERGRPLKEAIEEVRHRLRLEAFTLFALAIEAALEHGGRVNESLSRISESLLDNQRLNRKLAAETSSGRQVVFILAAFPAVFGALMLLLDPHSTSLLFMTLAGQCVLAVAVLCVYAGACWAARIMRISC